MSGTSRSGSTHFRLTGLFWTATEFGTRLESIRRSTHKTGCRIVSMIMNLFNASNQSLLRSPSTMIKTRKTYQITLSICEVVKEPHRNPEYEHVAVATHEVDLSVIEILKDMGRAEVTKQRGGGYGYEALKHAMMALARFIEEPFIEHSRKLQ